MYWSPIDLPGIKTPCRKLQYTLYSLDTSPALAIHSNTSQGGCFTAYTVLIAVHHHDGVVFYVVQVSSTVRLNPSSLSSNFLTGQLTSDLSTAALRLLSDSECCAMVILAPRKGLDAEQQGTPRFCCA
jgi:hypothetical protein